jgi:hypothetical protein
MKTPQTISLLDHVIKFSSHRYYRYSKRSGRCLSMALRISPKYLLPTADIHLFIYLQHRIHRTQSFDKEMPLKPEIFHGRDDFVKDIAQLLLQEETSRVCILGPGGMGKTSVSLAVVESPLIKERFPGGNLCLGALY